MSKKLSILTIGLAITLSVPNTAMAEEPSVSVVNSEQQDENPYEWLSYYKLKASDLQSYSYDELYLMRNAIFARHGYIFKKDELYNYFRQFSWYNPRYNDVSKSLSSVENANVSLIKSIESKAGRATYKFNNSNPFAFLSQRKVTRAELQGLSSNNLAILRNSIYARHGYIFKKAFYKNFFSSFSWYNPRFSNVESKLSEIEKANVQLIKSME